jgi:large repetitive protein
MRILLRVFLISCLFLTCHASLAEKLYWVGGTGNFNDPAHWSYSSGGQGGAKTPGTADDVYFDDNSFLVPSVVNIIGNAEVHDLIFSQYAGKVILSGMQHERLTVNGELRLNAYIDNQFKGEIRLTSSETLTPVFFSLAECKGNVVFDGNTKWLLKGNVITDANSAVSLRKGNFVLKDAGIYTGTLQASTGIILNTDNTTLRASNKLILPSGVSVIDAGNTRIYAFTKDPSKYQVAPDVNFNSGAKYGNLNTVMSCSVVNTDNDNPTCAGACNGTMTFTVPAGCTSNPVYAVWSTGFGCTSIPTGTVAAGGTYTVGGICGCGTQYSVIFTNDPNSQDSTYAQFNISIADPIPAKVNSFTLIQPSCFGGCNGQVIANLNTFGQLPITAAWTSSTFTGTTTHTITQLGKKDTLKPVCAGTFTVVLTDANGCVSTASVTTLGQPTQVQATPNITNLLCNNICTGVITHTVSGGTPGAGYTYTWSPAGGTVTSTTNTSTYSNLCAGTYTFITADANSCPDTSIVTVTQPPAITFVRNPASGLLNINCNNTCNGSVGVTSVAGGTGAYTFSWAPSGGTVTSTTNSSTYSGLCGSVAGTTYTCTITDANSCTVTATFTVVSPPALTNTITVTNPKCIAGQGTSTGTVTVTEGGGVPAYTFTCTTCGTQTGTSPTVTYTAVPPGSYTVNITDNNGCLDTATFTVTPPTALSGTMTTTNPTCPNLNNGQLCVTAGGGSPAYTYTWSPTGGNASCSAATLTVTPGGTSVYTVTITDANTCTVAVTGTLTSPPQVNVQATVTNPPCAGTCNGTATLTPSGGSGNYSYQWSCSASTTNTINGQCGGTTCSYTVTDATTACRTTGSLSFTVAPTLSLTVTSTTVACSYACTSTITATPAGGTPTYTYSWSGNGVISGNQNQVNMCVGNYTVTVTDNLGCTRTQTVAVTGPAAINNTVTVTNPKCTGTQGSTVGSATVTASGGTGGFTFAWTPTVTTSCASPTSCGSGMPPGTYTVIITDANSCQDTASVTLVPPAPVTATITTTTNPTCPNLNNGQLCVTAGGGSGAYTYTWSPTGGNASCSAATLTVTAGGSSVYTVTVSDANSCTVAVTGTLTSPPQATVTSAVTNVSCGSTPCTASATLTPTGGTGPFAYQWSCTVATTSVITNQCAGTTCNYTVTDQGTNCRYTGTVTFAPAPPTLTVNISATALACAGDCNSVITTTVNGGTAGYTYSWTGTGANPVCATCPSQINMCAGNYTVVVTDNLGCTRTATVAVTSPPAMTITMTPTQPSCDNSCNGSILASVSGGTAPYPGVSWSPSVSPPNPPTTLNPTGLCGSPAPGTTYTLIITDNNGCQDTATTTLIAPPSLTVSVATTSVTCSGLCNGSATATATGGTPGYAYSWDGGAFTSVATVSGLCAGSHTLNVRDTNNCTPAQPVIFTIVEPNPISVAAVNVQNTCGPCTGSASAQVNGGTAGYTYTWSPGGGNASSASGLCIGAYTLTVNDTNNCGPVSTTFTITPIVVITLSATSQSVSCNGACDGVASATASSGTAPYNMVWTTGASTVTTCSSVTSCTATSLCPGTYVITATDQNGCINSDSVVIGNPPLLTATVTTTNATCFGQCTGSATVTASGGTPAYTSNWSTGTSGNTISNLCPGVYTVTVLDNMGCSVVQTGTVGTTTQLNYTTTSTQPVACSGATGSLQITGLGGTPAYTFTWNPTAPGTVTSVSPTSTLTGIPAGVYSVTIMDANGCDTTIALTLSDPGSPTVTVTSQSVSCFGLTDGSATVTATGNNPITVTWDGGTPSGNPPITVSNLGAGTYTVQATDFNGCNAFQSVTINGPAQIIDSIVTVVNPTCVGLGSINVTPGGGTYSGYTYTWSPVGGNDSAATGLPAGSYTLVIANGACSQTFTYNLAPSSTPTAVVSANNTTCSYLTNGSASAVVNGGLPTYTYTWSNATSGVLSSGPNISNVTNLPADSYTLTVVDSGGCSSTQTFTITSPAAIVPNFSKTDNLCNSGTSGCTGSATVAPTGGTGGYTYNWSPGGGNTPTVGSLCPQSYTVIVSDGNGCQDTTTFSITDPAAIVVTSDTTAPLCNGGSTGSATITITGGTPGYQVTWSPNVCLNCTTVTNLQAGTYTVVVTDTNNCANTSYVVVGQPAAVQPIFTTSQPVCAGDSNGVIVASVSGGTPAYTFTWSPMPPGATVTTTSPTSTLSNIPADIYTVTIADANNCTTTSTFTLTDPTALTMNASATAATCGQSNGSITITGVTGTGTVSVNWLNPTSCGSSLNCNSLGAGVYDVELTDQNGCRDTFSIPVTNPNGPEIDSVVVHNSCAGASAGSITIVVVNGVNITTPYTFTWTTGGTAVNTSDSSTYSGLGNGSYIGTVVDSLGCATITSFSITSPSQIQDNGNSTSATCVGVNDGTITMAVTGGTPSVTGYTYTLDGTTTNTTGLFTGLAAGNHTVCVSDSLGCQVCFPYTIPAAFAISSQIASANIVCNGDCNGSATVSNINGGAAPYVISWNDPNSQSSVTAFNLCPGTYTATITDTNGCQAFQSATITEPLPLTVSAVTTDPTCGQCNGVVTVTPSGGIPSVNGYLYSWTPNGNTATISNVCAGVYQVNVTDSIGCQQSFQIAVSNDTAPAVSVTVSSPPCGSTCLGSATVTASGGSTPYTYYWPSFPGETGSTVDSLCGGLYFVQVTDSMNCTSTDSVQITPAVVLSVTSTMFNPPCNATTGVINASVAGGSGNYSYTWLPASLGLPNNDTITGLGAGIYTLITTDLTNGCTDTTVFGLNNNSNGPTLSFTTTDVLCNAACNGTATVSATGGTAPYSFQWNSGSNDTNTVVTGLCPNNYNVLVTDAIGCIQTGQISISQPNPLLASASVVNQPSCNQLCNGSIFTVVSGGTPGFSYAWSPASVTGSSGTNLCAGSYSVLVTDTNGCTVSIFDTLVDPPALLITGTVTPASCNTIADGAINTSTSGGTPALTAPGYTYQWSGGSTATSASLTNILVGNYTVVVSDSKNCTDTASFVVNSTVNIAVNAGPDTSACALSSITLNGSVNAGTSVQWIQLPNPPGTVVGTTATVTITPPVGTTQYVMTGTQSGCSMSDTITVTSNPVPTPDAGTTVSIFPGYTVALGGAPTNPSGGTVYWTPGSGMTDSTVANPVISPSVTTTYTVYETNSFGCVALDTITITVLPEFVIPNGFSPNGDGWNDVWQIDMIQLFPDCEVEVFNRWGEPLFYSKGYNTPWNGTYKGKPVPVGTYYYLIRLHDKEGKFPDHYTGPLTILR